VSPVAYLTTKLLKYSQPLSTVQGLSAFFDFIDKNTGAQLFLSRYPVSIYTSQPMQLPRLQLAHSF